MLPSALPPNPNLNHLKKQAKDLLRSHQAGDLQVCKPLQQHLPRFAQRSNREILSAHLSLHDAQHIIAQQYGFDNWAALRKAVTQHTVPVPTLNSLNKKMQHHIDTLGFTTLSAYRLWCRKHDLDSNLDKNDRQLQQERHLRANTPPEPVTSHRRGQTEKITRVYKRIDTRGWLVNLFDATTDESEREALYQLLIHIEKYSHVNWDAAAQLARYHREWHNPVETWFPKREGKNRQLAELTHHLLGREDVHLFRNTQLLQEKGTKDRQHPRRTSVLSQEEIATYNEKGYLHILEAFPRDAALKMQDFMWSELKRRHNFDRNDPSTWTMNKWKPSLWTALKLNQTSDHPIYSAIASPRLMGAYADITGFERSTYKQSWGPFRIHFPEPSDTPWHIGYDWNLWADRSDINNLLGIYTFYSHVAHHGGGSLIVEGSHHLVMTFFDQLTPTDFKLKKRARHNRFFQSHPYFAELSGKSKDQGDRTRRFMQETTVIDDVPIRVIELTAEPGDAIFYHPALLRGPSPNLSEVPRFMRG